MMKIKFKAGGANWQITEPVISEYYKIAELLKTSEIRASQMQMISILSGCPVEAIRGLTEPEWLTLWADAVNGPLSSLNTTDFKLQITIGDRVYKFIDLHALTIGELADMDTLQAHPQVDRQLHKMMAILYRPLGEDGRLLPHGTRLHAELSEHFLEKMPVSICVAAIDFFFHITKASLLDMMDSSVWKETETMIRETMTQPKDEITELQEVGVDSSISLPATTSLKRTNVPDLES